MRSFFDRMECERGREKVLAVFKFPFTEISKLFIREKMSVPSLGPVLIDSPLEDKKILRIPFVLGTMLGSTSGPKNETSLFCSSPNGSRKEHEVVVCARFLI